MDLVFAWFLYDVAYIKIMLNYATDNHGKWLNHKISQKKNFLSFSTVNKSFHSIKSQVSFCALQKERKLVTIE